MKVPTRWSPLIPRSRRAWARRAASRPTSANEVRRGPSAPQVTTSAELCTVVAWTRIRETRSGTSIIVLRIATSRENAVLPSRLPGREPGGQTRQNGVMSDLVMGFGLPVSGAWATPENVERIAVRAEEAGYGSLWTYQRLLAPAETDWGPQYRSVLDPVVAPAFAAAVTAEVRLGTAVINAPFVPPALLARQLASLDVLSQGRLDVGLGLGWAPEEFAALGVPFDRRAARLEDAVGVLTSLWGDDPVEFHGEFTDVPPSRFLPKPVQRPR